MTNPDQPLRPLTTARLEAVRAAATSYLADCADDLPLTQSEQVLALALAGVMPGRVRRDFGESEQAALAWVVASCCFLRLERPLNERRSADALYALLDDLEMFAPAAWAETYGVIERMLNDDDLGPADGPDLATET